MSRSSSACKDTIIGTGHPFSTLEWTLAWLRGTYRPVEWTSRLPVPRQALEATVERLAPEPFVLRQAG